ncbi:hypothetical protein LEP1GSC132_3776 [Leptospira kirschneri str. 200803703]|nr:hypothetical protein LEP1GSC044_3856 [Leptospira kirschneri serovar Grippotyphosa str. RM52]EMK05501.1 hypothetical protein LEP1GSC176_2894 [Leptospira kirschneri str. MMD1493]EMO69122.1 hypothetical protein LEP1GSC132_3776 [Leptospira kirschneri str. 200803703]
MGFMSTNARFMLKLYVYSNVHLFLDSKVYVNTCLKIRIVF